AAGVAVLLVVGVIGAFTVKKGGGSFPTGDPAVVVAAAADTANTAALHIDMVTSVESARRISFRMVGDVDGQRKVGRMTLDPDRSVFTDPIHMLQVGTNVYVEVPASRRSFSQGKAWARVDGSGFQSAGLTTGSDVVQQLATL